MEVLHHDGDGTNEDDDPSAPHRVGRGNPQRELDGIRSVSGHASRKRQRSVGGTVSVEIQELAEAISDATPLVDV